MVICGLSASSFFQDHGDGQHMSEAEFQQHAESALEALAEGTLSVQAMLAGQAMEEGVSLEGVLAQAAALETASHHLGEEAAEVAHPGGESDEVKPEIAELAHASQHEAEDTHDSHLEPKEEPLDDGLASLAQTLANAVNGVGDAGGKLVKVKDLFLWNIGYMVPEHIFIDQKVLTYWCGQYHADHLHFHDLFLVPNIGWVNLGARSICQFCLLHKTAYDHRVGSLSSYHIFYFISFLFMSLLP